MSKKRIQLNPEGFQNLGENFKSDKLAKDMLAELEKEAEQENRDIWNSMQMQRKFNEDLESSL